RGWIDVEGGRIVGYGQSGGGRIGSTTLRLGAKEAIFQAVALPDLRPDPTVTDTEVTFAQTCGGRTGVPAPRRVRRAPFVQFAAPLAWTTLTLTIGADASVRQELVGASPFPRHWVYDSDGKLVAKSGLINFSTWYRRAFGKHSPWGDQDTPAFVTKVETALERKLSLALMSGSSKPKIRKVKAGSVITQQGEEADEVFLVLDGTVRIDVDGRRVAEYGPGSLLGERAALEGGRRMSTVSAVTPCKLAVAPFHHLDREALMTLSAEHGGPGHQVENGVNPRR
ncbi:MAG TPA: cyclic nucleotide-binding domain-containing protein, partial [Acidimicrobiales bacterium]|nr:cyclic nucleotide-binding domain-containing protein [Acidimicrobiales bacterium]